MPAGKHGGYREYGFRDHEGDFDHIRNWNYEKNQGRGRDIIDYNVRVRHKDVKVREVINGGYRDSGSIGSIDREPGELSSDGSDGASGRDLTNVQSLVLDACDVVISEASPYQFELVTDFPDVVDKAIDDEYVPTRSIISSRWANDADSPAEEGVISDNEERARSSSIDSYRDRNDSMDLDDDTCVRQSDSKSEDDDCGSLGTPEPTHPPHRSVNMLQGCRYVDEFNILNKIDEGTYGVVFRAMDKKTGEFVALKKVKMEKEREGFPLTSLREINILLSVHHPSIVDVKEVVVGREVDDIFMVMEYMEHDLKGLMKAIKQPFSQSEVKCLMLQLLEGISYLHDNWILHRDLKTSNLLLNNQGHLNFF